ncbi:hypothetical protein F9C11_20695 [Amycolatopsis sp. VS8301801F10]|uniref:hypothetical protein n=1 Tax=Amycolatopsis sp. VS8301801F10 TaxID=2652442 RepID=UPI0038FD351F
MPEVAASRFDTLRTWNGEQSRAFEELSFQLLKDKVPSGTQAIRTGNPDGGVEWYATLPGGIEWGWQAKHVEGIDTLLTAMTDSVKRVAKERPELRKLTFAISWNLATGTSGGKRKSQRQKYEDKIKTWQQTIPGADKIEFDLVQESDLLDELAKPEHNGRRWFWWGDLVFGREWLLTRYEQQSAAASEKYRPDLQVDVPIQEDLLALGFDPSILTVFHRLVRDVVSAVTDMRLRARDEGTTGDMLYQAIQDTAAALKATAGTLTLQAGDPPAALDPLLAEVEACRSAIYAAEEHERQLEAAWRELSDDDPKKADKPSEQAGSYGVRGLASAIGELISWLESSVGRSLRRRAYFLSGQAGSGKTHLLLDATRRALDAGRPAVFLAGAQFGQGNLWASIADQLGLDAVGADVLLRAMDAAGEASGISGSRFVIFVDALNETTLSDFWRVHLPTLRAAIAQHPHIALAVSCRDTYQDLVLEGAEGSHYVRRTHPGFADREIEATQHYFAHYKLEAPKIPLLTPEFTLPLFLRLYCESLSQSEAGSIPEGHEGRVAIFERYLAAKTTTVARRFRPTSTSSYELNAAKSQVTRALEGLLDELSRLGGESMSTSAAEAVAQRSLGAAGADATRILGLLQEEGILTRERLYLGSGDFDEGVRIVFQAFADFLLLRRRLTLSDDPLNDPAVKSWLAEECSWGINEAATILFPEAYGIEMPDLLGIKLGTGPQRDEDRDAWDRRHRARRLYRSLVETLPYRDSAAISQRTIDLLNDAQPYLSRDEFYRVLFTLAPQPASRLNGDGLHRYLLRQRMPQRDSDFGFATYHELFEPFSPASRLARWAAAGPYPSYDAGVIELACVPLCWLLSSPNRFMRDWVTKALVQLLRGHLDVMRALVERFWTVDDPYVVQRVVAIAYGALLRSASEQAEDAKALAEAVHTRVFTRPVRADELMLDAARGIVRWAATHRLLPDAALNSIRRPYGLTPPGPPPTKATIEAKYGWREGQPDDESYSSISFSLLSMGDFGRYVVESGLRNFSRYRIGQDYPRREDRKPRFIKSRWDKFVAALGDGQKDELADWLQNPEESTMSRLSFLLRREDDPLNDEQHELLDAVFVYPKMVDDEYPADGARRWIFRRTVSLGWTPKLFGSKDRSIGHGRGREGHKAERWGKKYQWMAYHELLARVADNFQTSRTFGGNGQYEGLHQIIGDREIDPSLPPIDFRVFSERDANGATAWGPPVIKLDEWPPARLDFSRYQGDVKRFLADVASEPTVAGSTFVRDRDGNDWVVLESFVKKVDPLAHEGWRGMQERTGIDTLLITVGDAPAFLSALPDEPRYEISDLVDSHGHIDCCYVGEIGRVGQACHHRHDVLRQADIGNNSFRVVATVEQYVWEGSILDCSIGETARTVLPSTFIQQAAGLTFDVRGPSWQDAASTPVFTYYEEEGNDSHALLVRASFLRKFLAENELEFIVLHWFERMKLGDDLSSEHPCVESRVDAWLTADLALHEGKPNRMERGLR